MCGEQRDWGAIGDGESVGKVLHLMERKEVLEAAKGSDRHFAAVSERLGRPTAFLVTPLQWLLTATMRNGVIRDATDRVRSFYV